MRFESLPHIAAVLPRGSALSSSSALNIFFLSLVYNKEGYSAVLTKKFLNGSCFSVH